MEVFLMDVHSISTKCTRTEFVGTAVLDTIGLVISGVDDTLLKEMNIGTRYHTLGLFSSRTGAAGQITAVDDAVKATGTEVLSIEFPRDTKGWGGHGNYIVIGGNDVSDVRHAISLALELTNKYAGRVIYQRIRSFWSFAFFSQCRRCSCHGLSRSSRGSFRIHGRFSGSDWTCNGRHCNEGFCSSYYTLYDTEYRYKPFQ